MGTKKITRDRKKREKGSTVDVVHVVIDLVTVSIVGIRSFLLFCQLA